MSEQQTHAAGETGSRLIGSILLIVVTGIALGVAYNALQQQASPSRALAWVRRDAPLKSLEELQAALPAAEGPTAGVAAASEPPSPGGADPGGEPPRSPDPLAGAAGAAVDPTASKPSGQTGTKPAEKPAAKPAAPAPASVAPAAVSAAAKPADAPPAPPLPVIPDLKEPLEVKLATVKQFFDARAAVIVDARTPEEYAAGHIQGAVSLPFDDVARDQSLLRRFDAGGKPTIVYCGGGDCELSRDLAGLLLDAGQKKMLVYMGGYPEWEQAGYPVGKGAAGGAK